MLDETDSDSDNKDNYEDLLNEMALEDSEDDSDYSVKADQASDDSENDEMGETIYGKRIEFTKGYKIDL